MNVEIENHGVYFATTYWFLPENFFSGSENIRDSTFEKFIEENYIFKCVE